jgi:hypothetical protein
MTTPEPFPTRRRARLHVVTVEPSLTRSGSGAASTNELFVSALCKKFNLRLYKISFFFHVPPRIRVIFSQPLTSQHKQPANNRQGPRTGASPFPPYRTLSMINSLINPHKIGRMSWMVHLLGRGRFGFRCSEHRKRSG